MRYFARLSFLAFEYNGVVNSLQNPTHHSFIPLWPEKSIFSSSSNLGYYRHRKVLFLPQICLKLLATGIL